MAQSTEDFIALDEKRNLVVKISASHGRTHKPYNVLCAQLTSVSKVFEQKIFRPNGKMQATVMPLFCEDQVMQDFLYWLHYRRINFQSLRADFDPRDRGHIEEYRTMCKHVIRLVSFAEHYQIFGIPDLATEHLKALFAIGFPPFDVLEECYKLTSPFGNSVRRLAAEKFAEGLEKEVLSQDDNDDMTRGYTCMDAEVLGKRPGFNLEYAKANLALKRKLAAEGERDLGDDWA